MCKRATAVSLSGLPGSSALGQDKPRHRLSRAPGILATALLCATAFSQPNLAYAGPHGGGGGFQGGGGFHSDGPHGGGFDADRFHGDHDGRFDGDRDGRFDPDRYHRGGFFGGFYAYPGWGYYCSNPVGYYPSVTQCYTGWQTVPTS